MSEYNSMLVYKAEELLIGVPKSVKIVYDAIKKAKSPLKPSDLVKITRLTDRTIRSALKRLYHMNLVVKVPDLTDLRSHYLQLASVS